jgi:hypothetical protein
MGEQRTFFRDSVQFVVRTGEGTIQYDMLGTASFSDEVCVVDRVPIDHVGWASVRYKNRWYQLFGGIRTPYFVCLNSPIRQINS